MVFDVLDEAFHLVVGSLASFDDSAFEVQVLSRQRMVEVNRHFIVADAHHASQEAVAVFVLQRYHCSLEDVFVVEVVVYREDGLVQIHYPFGLVGAVSLVALYHEIELVARVQVPDGFLESLDSHSEACQKCERFLLRGGLFEHSLALVVGVELVVSYDIPMCCLFHCCLVL